MILASEQLRRLWNQSRRCHYLFWVGFFPLLGGVFCTWQFWLIAQQNERLLRVKQTQSTLVNALAAHMAAQRARVAMVLGEVGPGLAYGTLAQAAAKLHKRLPQLQQLELYSGDLVEVQRSNYRHFGYAKAAQLLSAANTRSRPLIHACRRGAHAWNLTLVMPLKVRRRPWAWAWMVLPSDFLRAAFDAVTTDGLRIVLQQSRVEDARPLLSRGAVGAQTAITQTRRVPGTTLWLKVSTPRALIVLPHSWLLAALLGLLGLGGAALCFWCVFLSRKAVKEKSALNKKSETFRQVSDPDMTKLGPGSLSALPSRSLYSTSATILDRSIFRAYDVRGRVGKTLNAGVARALGQAIAMVMLERGLTEIVIGRDGRLSGPELAAALAEGLRAGGVNVIDIGPAPTPVIYYAAYHFNTGSCVAVTGSHNPPDYNGFKIVLGGETLSEHAIDDLYQRMVSVVLPHHGEGSLRSAQVLPDYVERIASDVQVTRPLKVVIDCGNGIPGATAPKVLESIGCEIVPLHCEVDGHFPNHHPDPSEPENLQDLILTVKQTNADLGVAFDGDGDRLGVVTKDGEIIYPDRLLMLFSRDVLSRRSGATIIYDVKCTGHLKTQILKAGGCPLMWRSGHSLMKAKMQQTDAELAGEMSGHFFFKERWYGFDDGMYASARLLEILAGDAEKRRPEAIFATLPKGVSTPELKIEMREGEHYRFIEKFKAQAVFDNDASLVTIDGVRADWSDGWGLVRASNTTPALVLRFDADNAEALKRIQKVFRTQLLAMDAHLKLPF